MTALQQRSDPATELELLQKRAARFGFQVVQPQLDDGSQAQNYWLQNSNGELICGAENLFCLDILLTERFEHGGGKS
jgi:hypothetical protein